jgi:AcrR family transcriptional regulator
MARSYISPLRDEQAEATRIRIIEAVARVLTRGVAHLSLLTVAREAGVSVATVKRYFPTKSDLVRGLARHVFELQGMTSESSFHFKSLDELEAWWREMLEQRARIDPALRQAMVHPEANRMRAETRELRLAKNERGLAPLLARLSPRDRRRARDLIVLLLSTATANTWEMLIGSSPDKMHETLFWALKLIVGNASERRRPAQQSGDRRLNRTINSGANNLEMADRSEFHRGLKANGIATDRVSI